MWNLKTKTTLNASKHFHCQTQHNAVNCKISCRTCPCAANPPVHLQASVQSDVGYLTENYLYNVFLWPVNKAEALAYLDLGGPVPARYAKVIAVRGANSPPDVMEYKVWCSAAVHPNQCCLRILCTAPSDSMPKFHALPQATVCIIHTLRSYNAHSCDQDVLVLARQDTTVEPLSLHLNPGGPFTN